MVLCGTLSNADGVEQSGDGEPAVHALKDAAQYATRKSTLSVGF